MSEPRPDGVLFIHLEGPDVVAFAIGPGPWERATRRDIDRAIETTEHTEHGTAYVAGYWLDHADLKEMSR